MKDSRHKPKTPRTKRTEQGVPDIYKTSAKEFQKLLKRACRTSLDIVGRLSVPFWEVVVKPRRWGLL